MNNIHILSLNGRQQLAIRYLLYNLYIGFSKKMMVDLQDNPTKETLAIKVGLLQDAFHKYNRLVELLITPSGDQPRNKMLKLHPTFMKYVVFAVRGYDSANCSLKPSEASVVNSEIENLLELVEDSAQFTYSSEEIEKWIRRLR